MNNLSSEAGKFLLEICEFYNKSGKKQFSSIDVRIDIDDSHLYELDSAGYIIFNNDIASTIELTDKTINFASRFN
jgi:hypothetical protein